MLSRAVDPPAHIQYCLEQAIKLNPQSHEALASLEELKQGKSKLGKEPSGRVLPAYIDELNDSEDNPDEDDPVMTARIVKRIEELFVDLELEVQPVDPAAFQGARTWQWNCDPLGFYTSCSPEVAGILGMPGDAFVGKELKSFRLVPKSQLAVDYYISSGVYPVDIPVYFIAANEELIPIKLQIQDLHYDRLGQPGWHGLAELITYPEGEESHDEQPHSQRIASAESISEKIAENELLVSGSTLQLDTVCKYIRTSRDASTYAAEVNQVNRCYRSGRVLAIDARFRSGVCLTENHQRCPVYRNGISWPYPARISKITLQQSRQQRRIWILVGLFLLMLVALIGLFSVLYFTIL